MALDELRLWKIYWRKKMLALSRATNNFAQMIIKAIFLNKLVNDYECLAKHEAGLIEQEIV